MKRKMLFITFIFMFILLIFCSNSFATTEIEVDGTTYTLPDWWSSKPYRVFFIYNRIFDGIQAFCIACSNSPININQYEVTGYDFMHSFLISSVGDTIDFRNGVTNLGNDLYTTDLSSQTISNSLSSLRTEFAFNLSNVSYYSTHDVYNGDTLVFLAPVQETQEITLTQVLEEQKETNPQMVMKEILVILPTILVVVVSFLGLRKALAMLSAILHRS